MQSHEWYKAEVAREDWAAFFGCAVVSFNIVASNGLVRVIQIGREGQDLRERLDWTITMEQAKAALRTVRVEGKPVKDPQGPHIDGMLDRKYWA